MTFRAYWGAVGVNAIALLYFPGLTGSFRLLKWGVWSLVVAVYALAILIKDDGPALKSPAPDRSVFTAASLFAAWSVLAPLVTTPFATVHAAGVLQMGMGFFFAWLVALGLAGSGDTGRRGSLLILGAGGSLVAIVAGLQASGLILPGFIRAISAEFQVPGTLGNPNWTAAFLLPLVPIFLGLRASSPRHGRARLLRPACLGMAALVAAATVATRSKAGILALAAGIIVYLLSDPKVRRRLTRPMIIGIPSAVLILLAWLVSSGILQTLTWTRGRLFIWKACLALTSLHPFTGFGLGGFEPAYPRVLPLLLEGDPQAYMPLHRVEFAYNDILQTTVEAGIPAAVLFLVLVFFLLRRAFLNTDSLSRGVGAAVAGITIYGCFDSPLRLPGTLSLWWFLVGWIMTSRRPDQGIPIGGPGPLRRRAVLASFIALSSIFQAFRFGAADVFWTRGSVALSAGDYPRAARALETATAFLPENAALLSEAAKAFLLNRNPGTALCTADRALLTGFSFEDLFLRQRVIKALKGDDAVFEEWRRMARDYPGLFTPHIELARIYLKRNDPVSAGIELEIVGLIRQNNSGMDRPYKAEAERMLEQIRRRW